MIDRITLVPIDSVFLMQQASPRRCRHELMSWFSLSWRLPRPQESTPSTRGFYTREGLPDTVL